MIPVTYEPMEGVAVDVQDHAGGQVPFWTGTHGEMISSDLHGVKEPIRWIRGFALEKRRTFHQRHPSRA
jgi:hypothetical protein